MANVDEKNPPPKASAAGDARKFFAKHRTETLAAGAAAVVGLALLHRHNAAAAGSPVGASPADPGTTLQDSGYTYPTTLSGSPPAYPSSLSLTLKQPRVAPGSPPGKRPHPKPRPPKNPHRHKPRTAKKPEPRWGGRRQPKQHGGKGK